MNNLFPLATEAELTQGDNTCIICREEMTVESGAKKLPCNHIFHPNCLRTWFQRQQTCPTCRTGVLSRFTRLLQNKRVRDGFSSTSTKHHTGCGSSTSWSSQPAARWFQLQCQHCLRGWQRTKSTHHGLRRSTGTSGRAGIPPSSPTAAATARRSAQWSHDAPCLPPAFCSAIPDESLRLPCPATSYGNASTTNAATTGVECTAAIELTGHNAGTGTRAGLAAAGNIYVHWRANCATHAAFHFPSKPGSTDAVRSTDLRTLPRDVPVSSTPAAFPIPTTANGRYHCRTEM